MKVTEERKHILPQWQGRL